MNMRLLMVVSFVSFTGCLVPVSVLDRDAGLGGGSGGGGIGGGGGGSGGGLASCVGIQTTTPPPQPSGTVGISLQGCDPRPVVLTGPDGSAIDAGITVTSGTTAIDIAGAAPGRYTITVGTGLDAQVIGVEVYDQQKLDAGVVRTYVDRIDTCSFVAVTDEDRLVCQREHEVWIYEPDGGHHTHFPGDEVGVANNEVWSRLGTGIELRVDGPGGLLLSGAVPNAGLVISANETAPGRTIRAGAQQLVEFTWDGTTLGSRSWWISIPYLFFFRDAETLWSSSSGSTLCTTRPGCQDHLCDPVGMCPFMINPLITVAVSPDRAWVLRPHVDSGLTVAELKRPIDSTRSLTFRTIPSQSPRLTARTSMERPVFPEDGSVWTAVIVVASEDGPSFFRRTRETVLANTSSWVLTSVDPFSVRFTPVQ